MPDQNNIPALMRRAMVLLRAYATHSALAGQIDRSTTCDDVADELAEALAPRAARLMPPIAENASGNREVVL